MKRGKWQACPTIEGRRVYGPQRNTRKEAYEDALMMIARAEGQQGDEIELVAASQRWLDYHRRESKPGTVAFYAEKIESFILFVGPQTPLWDISGRDCERFLEFRRERGERGAKLFRRAVNAFFAWCMGEGLLKENPLKQVPAARLTAITKARQERFSWLPEEFIMQICDAVDEGRGYWRDHRWVSDVVRCLYLTGLRRSESCRLVADSVDFSRELIYVDGKREAVHDTMDLIPITEETGPILKHLIESAQRRGKRSLFFASPTSLNKLFAQVRDYIEEILDAAEVRKKGRERLHPARHEAQPGDQPDPPGCSPRERADDPAAQDPGDDGEIRPR
jgi:integrase